MNQSKRHYFNETTMTGHSLSLTSVVNESTNQKQLKVSVGNSLNRGINERIKDYLRQEFKAFKCLGYWRSHWDRRTTPYSVVLDFVALEATRQESFSKMLQSWNQD